MPSVMHTISGISASIASQNRVRRARRRHVDHAGVGPGLLARLRHGVEHRQVRDAVAPPLPGRDAADHLGAVGDRLLGVEGAVLAA